MVTEEGKTMAEVAKWYKFPPSTIRAIVNTFLDTNQVDKLPRGGDRRGQVNQEHLDWLTDKLDEFAGRPVQLLAKELNEHFGLQPPIIERTLARAINMLTTYTLKLMRVESERYNDPEYIMGRQEWARQVNSGPGNMNHFIYIDEAGFNLHITRKYGRAPRGRRAFQSVPYNRGPNFSLIVAVDKTGIVAFNFKQAAYNQATFTEFLQEKLFPEIDGRRRIIVMDNAKFHKTQMVRDAFSNTGHTLLFLPPYSPHLNAAESVFSSVKTHVRQQIIQAETLSGHVRSGLERITDAMARGWIREVGRNFQMSLQGEPLGRLYDTRQGLPEGYQDPYAEGWDDEQVVNEDEDNGEDDEDEGEQETEEDDSENEEAEAEDVEDLDVEVLTTNRRRYSPLRTRSGKERN